MTPMRIFSDDVRTDPSPRRANEPSFSFLDRTAHPYFAPVRDLLETWLARVSIYHRAGLIGDLRAGDAQFESAFWELYLHTALVGSGYDVEIHPELVGTSRRPDFLVQGSTSFYLEAVAVGVDRLTTAESQRLQQLEAVLDRVRLDGVTLNFEHHVVGPQPVRAGKLRDRLLRWVEGIDPELLASTGHLDVDPPSPRHYEYDEDGWYLVFEAVRTTLGRPNGSPMIGMRGTGRAQGVDNETGLRRVLDRKARSYGSDLPHPLVIAVLSNTDFPTYPHDIEPVLYGRPLPRVGEYSAVSQPGHWRTSDGWRRSHNPTVLSASGLNLYSLARVAPLRWDTMEPDTELVEALPWANDAALGQDEGDMEARDAALVSLGIDRSWCAETPVFMTTGER